MEKDRIVIDEKYVNFGIAMEDLILSIIGMVGIAATFVLGYMLGYMMVQWIVSKICGND